MMYATCIHCTRDLGRNEMVETLPIGRRLAFDAGKGRLWVVCASCGKWNLVPFDTRLESIDACERLFRDTLTRYSTDNIGMAKVGDGLTLVRVGKALRPEFASWRYGEQYKRRRRVALAVGSIGAVTGLGVVAGAGALLGAGVWFAGYGLHEVAWGGYKLAISRRARLRASNPETGAPIAIPASHLRGAVLGWEDDAPVLLVPRSFVLDAPDGATLRRAMAWRGADIPSVGRRVAGALNLTTGSDRQLRDAVTLLSDNRGDLSDWLDVEARNQRRNDPRRYSSPVLASSAASYWDDIERLRVQLNRVAPEHRLALEMWFSEDIERRWLEGELRLLEREWREAETLAKIADDLVLESAS